MNDPYRYFRVEARELVDELTAGLAALARGEAAAVQVAGLLRHAHTLKGAARVVSQAAIADHTHALEGLLGPYRGGVGPVPPERLEEMRELVAQVGDLLRALDRPAPAVLATETETETAGASSRRGAGGTGGAGGAVAGALAWSGAVSGAEVGSGVGSGAGSGVRSGSGAAVPAQRTGQDSGPQPVEVQETRTARASLAEIDAVIDGIGDTRTQLSVLRECATRVGALREHAGGGPGLPSAVDSLHRALVGCADRMDRELRQAHDVAERLRLVPVSSIVPDLEGAARDVAAVQGKRVHLEVDGGRLRLDAPLLSAVQDALRQIVRNAVAHGLESPPDRLAAGKPAGGRIRLQVTRHGGEVTFRCTDDGRGIDLDAVRQQLGAGVRAPALDDEQVLERLSRGGVSTAAAVSEVSGRGIGLDLVHDTATRLGGRVEIRTAAGSGTTVGLTTPLSLSAQDVLLVDAGQLLALPLAAVRRTVRVAAAGITSGLRGQALQLDGEDVPFLPLADTLAEAHAVAGPRTASPQPSWPVVVVAGPAGRAAVGVRRLIGTTTIAIRPVPAHAPVSALVSGLWVDVDAHPQLVLDVDALVRAAVDAPARSASAAEPLAPILIVDDSLTTRMLEQSVLEAAGYRVELAASAEEGLLMAARSPYALALVDVEMPGMDGFGFVEQTRARPELRHLPCILVTSRASAADRERGLAAGARAHLDKRAFHQGTLLRTITDVLDG